MLQVHQSNRTEVLLRRFLAVTEQPLRCVLTPEICVVQHPGMARWLNQQIASARGIAANVEFPLPASFVWEVYQRVLGNVPERSRFQRDSLLWRIMARLDDCMAEPSFRDLRVYLDSGSEPLKKFQLCGRIADIFDQYSVYRPDMLLAWEAGEEGHWQAILWRELTAAFVEPHRARLWRDLCTTDDAALEPRALPERVSLFAISALPPAYLEVISRIASATEVHLFALNPCREYWGDIEDERAVARRRAKKGAADYVESGNPLLASLGTVGRDFQDQVLEVPTESSEVFEEPGAGHLLGAVQTDILALREGAGGGSSPGSHPGGDRSIQVHSCHGRLREVQVLHDRILEMFERLPGLAPRDIVVMAPDIDEYAALIEAELGATQGERRLPYTVADRSARSQHPLVESAMTFLDLPESRLGFSEVLDWMHTPAVMRRLGLDEAGVDRLREWAADAGVRWGAHAAMRAALGLPGSDGNTWSFGFDRLFAGYALPAEARTFDGILPYPDIEGSDAALLGPLRRFLALLERWRAELSLARSAEHWRDWINAFLDECFLADESELDALQAIRDAMGDLVVHAREAGFADVIEVDLLASYLKGALSVSSGGGRFLAGGVTFCNLVPMRSIPFRVVCLLGMDDQAFPRAPRPVGFDLIASRPRRGDRSRREDDRYLFLESLLSARDVFYVSFTGRDPQDNSPRMPAVVVSELLDYIDSAYRASDSPGTESDAKRAGVSESGDRADAGLREMLVTEHPLQPFSRRSFDPASAGIWSYATEWCPSASVDIDSVFADCRLPEPDGTERRVPLDDLLRFFENPCRFFLKERLQIDLWEGVGPPDDAEPFRLGSLDRYWLRHDALRDTLAGGDPLQHRQIARARGDLPHGAAGDDCYDQSIAEPVAEFASALARFRVSTPEIAGFEVDTPLARISGILSELGENGMVLYRLGRLRARDRISAWIRHLCLNLASPEGAGLRTWYLSADKPIELAPVADPSAHLTVLMGWYWQGRRQVLPFYPESSFAYARETVAGKSPDAALGAARKMWAAQWRGPGDGDDPAIRVALRGVNPFADPFPEIAIAVFAPLLAASGDSRNG